MLGSTIFCATGWSKGILPVRELCTDDLCLEWTGMRRGPAPSVDGPQGAPSIDGGSALTEAEMLNYKLYSID